MKYNYNQEVVLRLYKRIEHILFGDSVIRKTKKKSDDLKEDILFEFSKAIDQLNDE